MSTQVSSTKHGKLSNQRHHHHGGLFKIILTNHWLVRSQQDTLAHGNLDFHLNIKIGGFRAVHCDL
jgi:hypothetical protein